MMRLDFSSDGFPVMPLVEELWQQEIVDFVNDYLNHEVLEVHTSGSTGIPQSFFFTKAQLQQSVSMTEQYFELKRGQIALHCLPMTYIAGKMMVIRAIEIGMQLICLKPSSQPLEYLPENVVINFAAMVPLQVERSYTRLAQIKILIIGGAALSDELTQKLYHLPIKCLATYGMTETLTHIAVREINPQVGSVYKLLDRKKITIAQDERGCLSIEAPLLNDQKIITNDCVELIDDQTFRIKGRIDNTINSGGIKIFPEEIEQRLKGEIPYNDFFIAGLEDNTYGQRVVLLIEGNNNSIQLEDLKKYVAGYTCPKEIISLEAFVRTASGKINRKQTLSKLSERFKY